jgi:hypothetical protein
MAQKLQLGEAAAYLGVSRQKVWLLVKKGVLQTHKDPLDERGKVSSQ